MKILALTLTALILLLQYPLWLGKGSWLRVWELSRQVDLQKAENAKLQQRNSMLDAEVRDLKQGFDAIEERARYELGMIRQGEMFFQVVRPFGAGDQPASAPGAARALRNAPGIAQRNGPVPLPPNN